VDELTPRQIVAELDKFVVGQAGAKRSVAVALRNRYRRNRLPPELKDEVVPKNILMIGPTGVGKTEIARRIARMVKAPFVKVEATKFTEVGYVGRDVDSMVRELVETSLRMVRAEKLAEVEERAQELAEERLIDILAPLPKREGAYRNPLEALFGAMRGPQAGGDDDADLEERRRSAREARAQLRRRLATGEMEGEVVEIEVDDTTPPVVDVLSGAGIEEMAINFQDVLGGMLPRRKKKRKVTIAEARRLLAQEEASKLIDQDQATAEAIRRAEQSGIIFIDEIDKIAGRDGGAGPDVSREGVQRDILPIVEGSTVMTKYGPVKTDHMLFIAAGAFHTSKPTDLIPELQGRFPVRVELEPLSADDLRRILVEPENALTKQYAALLATDGVTVTFTDDGIDELAATAQRVNEQTENIGARRLHTIMERLLEDVSFEAPEGGARTVSVDAAYVRARLAEIAQDRDLSRFIL
jgi:ATP-dependent HslUV protease ATP-binding subunit HslU